MGKDVLVCGALTTASSPPIPSRTRRRLRCCQCEWYSADSITSTSNCLSNGRLDPVMVVVCAFRMGSRPCNLGISKLRAGAILRAECSSNWGSMQWIDSVCGRSVSKVVLSRREVDATSTRDCSVGQHTETSEPPLCLELVWFVGSSCDSACMVQQSRGSWTCRKW
jgi:hypothetical protein